MALKQVIEISEILESPAVDRDHLRSYFQEKGLQETEIAFHPVATEKGKTTFVNIHIHGAEGKASGGAAPTLGIIGRLGGIGARPHRIGLVSDADGAITALACAGKILDLRARGDVLPGDVMVATHLSPASPITPHEPVPFMDAPVPVATMNAYEVDESMEAILSIDTTRGNRVINHRGFAISPTVKDGYILRVSEDLLEIMQHVTGCPPVVFPITTQDITPYGNGLFHLNSIMQPATATHAPVVGVALTSEVPVPGCATGANHPLDIEAAVRFVLEVAKAFGRSECAFYDPEEFERIRSLYGSMEHLKTLGRNG